MVCGCSKVSIYPAFDRSKGPKEPKMKMLNGSKHALIDAFKSSAAEVATKKMAAAAEHENEDVKSFKEGLVQTPDEKNKQTEKARMALQKRKE